jgi:hypothetical protein
MEVPFLRTVAQAAGISTIRLTAIEQNILIDDAMFTKSPGLAGGLKLGPVIEVTQDVFWQRFSSSGLEA